MTKGDFTENHNLVRTCQIQSCPSRKRRNKEDEHIWLVVELVDAWHS